MLVTLKKSQTDRLIFWSVFLADFWSVALANSVRQAVCWLLVIDFLIIIVFGVGIFFLKMFSFFFNFCLVCCSDLKKSQTDRLIFASVSGRFFACSSG